MSVAQHGAHRIRIERVGENLRTVGLARGGHPEIQVRVGSAPLDSYEEYLQIVSSYAATNPIKDGESVRHGYWLTRMALTGDGILDAWEYRKEGDEFVRGVDLAVTYWRTQQQLCEKVGAEFSPPFADQKAAVSPDILTGHSFTAARYPSPAHMSGWWLLSDTYDGDVNSLAVIHLYHVTAAREDVAPVLALPFGYRVEGDKTWFDPSLLEDD